jgi:hypothetical protein
VSLMRCVVLVLCAPPFQYAKHVVKEALGLISDKRAVMRTSVFALLDAWVTHGDVVNGACLEKVRQYRVPHLAACAALTVAAD